MTEEHDLQPWSNARTALLWLYTALQESPGQTALGLIEDLQAHLHSLGRELPSTITVTDLENAEAFSRRLELTAEVMTPEQLKLWEAWFEENDGDIEESITQLLSGAMLPLSLLPYVGDPVRLCEAIRALP